MKKLLLICLLFHAGTSFAQKSKRHGENVYTVAFNGNACLNRFNADYGPANTIFPKTTIGYDFSVEYSRITRYNLTLTAALDYGMMRHSFDIVQHFDDFDPDAVEVLKGSSYQSNVSVRTNFIAPRVMLGYTYRLTHSVKLVGKIGIRRCIYTNGIPLTRQSINILYHLDNRPSSSREFIGVNMCDYQFGANPNWAKASKVFPFKAWTDSWEFYVGAEKDVKSFWVRSVGLGINIRRSLTTPASPSATDFYVAQWQDQTYKQSYYFERNYAVGLVLSASF